MVIMLSAAALRQVIEDDLGRLIGMSSAEDRRKKNPSNSFTTEDAQTILHLIDRYAEAKLREHILRERIRQEQLRDLGQRQRDLREQERARRSA